MKINYILPLLAILAAVSCSKERLAEPVPHGEAISFSSFRKQRTYLLYFPMFWNHSNPRDATILHLCIWIQAFCDCIGNGFLFQFLKKFYLFLLVCYISIYLGSLILQITHNLLLLCKRGKWDFKSK